MHVVTVVVTILGLALVVLVSWDAALTVLHPGRRGPLTSRAHRAGWAVLGMAVRNGGGRRLLTAAGPLAMATHFVAWVGGAWLGFALVYAANIDDLVFQREVPFGATGWPEALYVSGSALTTVGFGDIVASSDILRIVIVVEAAAGLALFTCAVTYILSVYPIVGRMGAAAHRVQDYAADSLAGAALLVRDGGRDEVGALQRDLIDMHEQLQRFPVVDYFRPAHGLSYPLALSRAGAVVYLVLVHAPPAEAADWARTYGRALGRTLRRIGRVEVGDDHAPGAAGPMSAGEATATLERLRAGVADALGAMPAPARTGPDDLARDLGRMQRLVDALAEAHGYPPHSLLPARPSDGARAGPSGESSAGR